MTSSHDYILAALRQEFPGYRLWLEPVRGEHRFVARRLHLGTGTYAVVTSDPAELRSALAPSAQEDTPPTEKPELT